MPPSFNILLSCAGHRVERVRILRATLDAMGLRGRVVTADAAPLSAAAAVADAAEILPPCRDAGFVPALLDVCKRHEIHLVIPEIDPELPVLAAARDQFSAVGATLLISAPQAVLISGDKIRTHEWLVASGFPTVKQGTPEEALAAPNDWMFPLIVKPAGGSASAGVARVLDAEELRYTTRRGGYVVQTVATGHEYTTDCLVNRTGKCVCAVPRRRIEVRSGEVFKGVTARVVPVIELATKIAETLPGAYGPLNIQMFYDEKSGALAVIEINARMAGGFPLAWQAGADFPRWIIEEILGLPSTARADAWREGLVMLRYYEAVFTQS